MTETISGLTGLPVLLEEKLIEWGLGASAKWVSQLMVVAGLLLLALLAYLVARPLIVRALVALSRRSTTRWDDALGDNKVFHRLAHLLPALILNVGAPLLFLRGSALQTAADRLTLCYLVVVTTMVAHSFLKAVVQIYRESFDSSRRRPIRAYVQVVQIFVWVCATVLMIAILVGQSPWALLGGVGALTAVLMLVFKDSILGLVASIQVGANDMVREGDWISMPGQNVDGTVIEFSLTTVKVQNWDKSIATVPTHKLISEVLHNWRGMYDSGVRRIVRSLLLDVATISFVDEEQLQRLRALPHVVELLPQLEEDPAADSDESLTNVGLFRAYAEAYARQYPGIEGEATCVVRRREPTDRGMPLQLYAFSREQSMAQYEAIAGGIFDHLMAMAPQFDLRIFQLPSGEDLREVEFPVERGA